MRPLVVLLLVLAAGLALLLSLWQFGPSSAPPIDTPSVAAPNVPAVPAKPEQLQTPAEPARTVTEDGAAGDGGMSDAALVERPGNNSLYGLVTNDSNQPLPGARVELSRDPRMGEEMAMTWITERKPSGPPLATMTDAKGQYRFTNVVPRSNYYLIASHPDLMPVQEQMVAVGDSGDFQGPNFVLTGGSTVEGTVTDSGGNLVTGAELWLDSAFYSGVGESPDRLIATSDASGHFEFRNVYAVTKQLTCMAEGYGSQTKSPVSVLGTPGEKLTIDFQLAVGQPIAGKVLGSDGMGIKGAEIIAYNTGNNISFRGQCESLEDGSFTLLNLHPGSYILSCTAKGYRQQKHTRVAVGNMAVVIDMLAQACVNGRVVEAASGKPVDAFTVSVRRVAPKQQQGFNLASEETGLKESFAGAADGSFTLCGLDPGTYALMASSNNSAPTLSDSFTIVAEQRSVSIEVRLSTGGTIKGRIVGPNGAGIGGAVVQTHDDQFDEDTSAPLFADLVPTNITSRRVVTNGEGYFELRALTPEKYQIRVSHPKFAQGKKRDIQVVEAQPTDVGSIAMMVGGTVKGTVFGQGGVPLQRGFVHLEAEMSDLVYDTRTDSEGRYVFTHVRPGNFTLSATGKATSSNNAFEGIMDMRSSQVQITVTEGGETPRDLSLSGG